MKHPHSPTEMEILLLTDDQRRTVSVGAHQAFRESLNPKQSDDELEDFVEELRKLEFEEKGARS